MNLKCITDKIDKRVYENLTVNKEYIVLSIELHNSEISFFVKFYGDYVIYRIEDDDGLVNQYLHIYLEF